LEYNDGTGFVVKHSDGHTRVPIKITNVDFDFTLTSSKTGSAAEAAGNYYALLKDASFPAAWVPGSPGVNGYWTDASNNTNAANPAGATETGAFYLPNAASGKSWWLSDQHTSQNLVQIQTSLIDLLWYNTGLAVTTTTNQAISQPGTSIPARDTFGTTNGESWFAGIYVTTATTNGSAVTNTTLTYTNSDGTGSRTGTMASFPATAVAGTFVPFFLAAGDRGIRSIQGVTLGTSYGGGAISLVMFRKILQSNHPVAHLGNTINRYASDVGGTRIYNGTSFWQIYIASATTATIPMTNIILSERAVL
jgi:hypothetical protein